MLNEAIAQYRLSQQQIAGTKFKTPGQIVAWLGAMQAQDYAAAKWAIGLRLPKATEADIEQAIAGRTIVRTWPMRGTLHFVAAEDVRWMLALLTPRVMANSTRRHKQLELDGTIFTRAKDLFAQALQGGRQLTRQEMMQVLEQAGIATGQQRGYHILVWAAQTGFICFGPMRGKQPTFVWLDEWLPPGKSLARDEALAALALRYFTGHGPATLQDFGWWSGLVAAEARAGLNMVKSQLCQETLDGQTYWMSPDTAALATKLPATYLLPGFDEYLLGYRDRRAVLDPAYAQRVVPGGNGIFNPILVINGQVVGTWKRTFKKEAVAIALNPFQGLNEAEVHPIAVAAERYGLFVNRPVARVEV